MNIVVPLGNDLWHDAFDGLWM